ncbi:PAS domain S-box protein [Nisaea sediminum]|uniref:PAS domain S-box protein n=1 Tax=Nisaea sediminum TaxID=2775867 RepID=UPI0018689466|nr:PAS domain S-box protein [Nisaea sediminum]
MADRPLEKSGHGTTPAFDDFLARLPVPAMICSSDGIVRSANSAASALAGVQPRELIGAPIQVSPRYSSLGSAQIASFAEAIVGALHQETPITLELEFASADGSSCFFSHVVSRFDDPASSPGALILAFDVTAQKIASRDLEDRTLELEAIFENAPVMIGMKAPDGRWNKVNRFFASILSMEPEQMSGKRSDDFWPPDVAKQVREHDRKIVETDVTNATVLTTTSYTGRRTIYGTKFPIRNSAGELSYIGFVGVDISDLVEAKKEAELVSFRLREAQRIGNMAYWTWNRHTGELFWSEELFRLLSWDPREHPADVSEFFQRIHPEDRKAFLDRTRQVDEGFRAMIEYRFMAGDGRQIWLYDESLPAIEPDGQKFGILHDITERKEAEIRLRDSEKRLSMAKRIAGLGMWEVDQVARKLIWSEEVYAMLGLEKNALNADISTWKAFIHPDDHETYRTAIKNSFVDRRAYQVEYRALHTDGSYRIILEHGEHEFDASGTAIHSRGTFQDITELKSLHSKLIESQKLEATAALAGGLTHDFNNILGAIAGNLDVMEIRGAARHGFEAPIDRIRQAIRSGQSLTQRLLNFSQNTPPEPTSVSLNRAIENIVTLIGGSIGKCVSLEFTPSPEPLCSEVDISGLETALLNQILNAREAMENGGSIRIALSRADPCCLPESLPRGSYVALSITDDGPGMLPDVAQNAFEAFFTTKRDSGGTGLGLYMVRTFVRLHGGEAILETALDLGTRLTLFLPETTAQYPETALHYENTCSVQHRGKILVVEDQPGIRAFIEDCLRENGYAVEAVASADEAEERFSKSGRNVDALICDINLGSATDGFALARRFRARNPGLAIVFVSGYADNERTAIAGKELGAPLIKKPFRVEDLLTALQQTLHG